MAIKLSNGTTSLATVGLVFMTWYFPRCTKTTDLKDRPFDTNHLSVTYGAISGGSYVGTAELQHPLFSRYILFLGQFVLLLWYLVMHAQEVLTMCPPWTKCFARTKCFVLHPWHEQNVLHGIKYWTFIYCCVGSTANDENLELWVLTAPVSL